METNKEYCSEKKEEPCWSSHEDQILFNFVQLRGEGNWRDLPKRAGLKRCGESCKQRWLNYLKPAATSRGSISLDEHDLILRLHKLLGNRWSIIAGRLPGRTADEIKNYWNTYLSKDNVAEEKQNKNKFIPSTSVTTTTTGMPSVQSPLYSQNSVGINPMVSPNHVIIKPKVVRLTKVVAPRHVELVADEIHNEFNYGRDRQNHLSSAST